MSSTRRLGGTDSKSRSHLLDVAESMMLADGFASVTSRRLGTRAGVSPQLVHYYFRTMDELFVEVFRRRAEENLDHIVEEFERDNSLQQVWRLASNPLGTRFSMEFVALANHRKAIGEEIAAYGERFRKIQQDAVAARLEALGISEAAFPPVVALLALTGIAQFMAIEASMGITNGHATASAFIENFLVRLEAGEIDLGQFAPSRSADPT
jgi:AcrR family transcriptional regulator